VAKARVSRSGAAKVRARVALVQAGILGFLTALLLGGLYLSATVDIKACPVETIADPNRGLKFAGLAVVGLLIGRFVGSITTRLLQVPFTANPAPRVKLAPYIQWFLAIFLSFTFLCLLYETAAVAGLYGWPPITTYVRCAVASPTWPVAAAGTLMIFGLLGNWLWYPTRATWSGL
jgi:hypothetical protein